MRQIVLDTETTGLEPSQGHRIIEVGCVELIDRKLTGNHFHRYIKPERDIDEGAIEVHGITNEFLADKPVFADIAEELLTYLRGAELVIHNAPFDVGFLNHEYKLLDKKFAGLAEHCTVLDTLTMAREKHPGQKNNLDALCKRYEVDNSQRDLHGALLDAEILADVYLLMSGGQTALSLGAQSSGGSNNTAENIIRLSGDRPPITVIKATAEEIGAHNKKLNAIGGPESVWQKLEGETL